jgi:ribosomal protein S18 acetylase RimI-like enzyme
VKIVQAADGKRDYMDLLMLADPSVEMIDRYLDMGELFVMKGEGKAVGVAVVMEISPEECELKNLAVCEKCQKRGYGRQMLEFLFGHYAGKYKTMLVGTAETGEGTVEFYQKNGFCYSHSIPGFFEKNYFPPIYEGGQRLRHMVCLKRKL